MIKKRTSRKAVPASRTPVSSMTKERKKIQKKIERTYDKLRNKYPEIRGKVVDFVQHELQRSPFILLAQRWASESNKDGGVGQAVADAFFLERCIAGVEIAKRLQRTWGFCISLSSPQRQEATGPCRCTQTQDPAGLYGGRHNRRRLAHVSAHGWGDAGRDGRTSTHDPRLLASQQSSCDEQVSSGNTGAETPGTRKIGRCDLARWVAAGEQINADSVVGAGERVLGFVRRNAGGRSAWNAYWTQTDPDFFLGQL